MSNIKPHRNDDAESACPYHPMIQPIVGYMNRGDRGEAFDELVEVVDDMLKAQDRAARLHAQERDSTENPKPGTAAGLVAARKRPPTITELEAILKAKDAEPITSTCDGMVGAQWLESQLERDYSNAVAYANESKYVFRGSEYAFKAVPVLDSWKRADAFIGALKEESSRWKSRYEEKGVDCGGLFDSLSDAREVITNQDAAITNKNKTISDLEHALDVSRAALERMRVRSEDDERGKAVARSMEMEARLKKSDDHHLTRDLAELDAVKVFGRLGLVAKEIAGISDNAPSMECIDAINKAYTKQKAWAGMLLGVLRRRSSLKEHEIDDICERASKRGIVPAYNEPF